MPEIPNGFYRTSIKALILDENKKFLLTREEKGRELPGGGLDFGELPQEGIKRELQEEMGINVISVNENQYRRFEKLHTIRGMFGNQILQYTRSKKGEIIPKRRKVYGTI